MWVDLQATLVIAAPMLFVLLAFLVEEWFTDFTSPQAKRRRRRNRRIRARRKAARRSGW